MIQGIHKHFNIFILSRSGYYWIDPNLGMSDDAVKVHCDMEKGGETCVFPDVHASKMPNIPWRKSGNGWYSSLRGGFKVNKGSYIYSVHRKYDSKTNKSLTIIKFFPS